MKIRSDGKKRSPTSISLTILQGRLNTLPWPTAKEGLPRAILAIDEAVRTGETVRLDPSTFKAGMQREMLRAFAPTTKRLF